MSPAGEQSRAFPAPAKINLFLHVVGRRSDGYHLLQSVFRFLDFGDTLRFTVRQDSAIALHTPLPGVPVEQDLTVRAACLLQNNTNTRRGADIWLEKRLPLGGGLGGGSSNAATVLLALNHLWQTGLSRSELQSLGLQLGADVPVFIHGHTAFAEGVGEVLSDVVAPPAWYLVLIPPANVPTASIFSAPDLVRNTTTIRASDWQPGFGHNDLTPVACRLYPVIADYLALLGQHAPAFMSGSGACVFAAFPSQTAAQAVLSALPAGIQGFVAAGLDRHPLAQITDKQAIH